jgi:RHH-type proline utilization regulon transcriptional repressor/proline dehydrogenase/delta 1-pyrroline-5-carboxylate dehydrogenase
MLTTTHCHNAATKEETVFSPLLAELPPAPEPLRAAVSHARHRDEPDAVRWLLDHAQPADASDPAIRTLAQRLVQSVRAQRAQSSGVDALMHEFSLSSDEGVALMCLAEALLRIPDRQTANRLIADKISKGDWRRHLGESPSLFVNAATWGLVVTGKLVGTGSEQGLGAALTGLIAKGGEPLIRKALDLAMRMLGNQFVTGQTIEEALRNSRANEARGYRYSYDMLGEAALTEADARQYCAAYEEAIRAIGRASDGRGIKDGPGISVKLSALHPRYSRAQRERVMCELLPRLKHLAMLAKHYGIGLNIDAEEADRLELSLDVIEALAFDRDLDGFDGIGIVVQAYQKRCPFVIDYLIDLAGRSSRRFMVRLVKGAYWDAEIKRAQIAGLPGYPVYTRKVYTDVSYLVCAQKLLAAGDRIYPQFATHNAHTVATIHTWARKRGTTDYEFQCLHGMGEPLYHQIVGKQQLDIPCRIYAPVGSHQTLLAYLVRRLLENGANSSFVNQIVDDAIPIESLIADPFSRAASLGGEPHPKIPMPADMFGAERKNSSGIDLSDENALRDIGNAFASFGKQQWHAAPLINGAVTATLRQPIFNPADRRDIVGRVIEANTDDVDTALAAAAACADEWQSVPPSMRSETLTKAADMFEAHRHELMALAIREAGKSLPNAIAEVREAVDFLRYYAAQIDGSDTVPALGPVACISPWNFPLAIFAGEVSAALAAGNVVLAKPAEQTPLIACRAVQLLHEAGVPRGALQLLPGRGDIVGARLTADARVRGVIFTGSTDVAQLINRTLAARAAAESTDIPFIAETGGQNAMIVDSSALPEQAVQDAIASAFDSAGQRCSALRVLCLQTDIADRTLTMLRGAMQQLRIGNPAELSTDIGPVIDSEARAMLLAHIEQLKSAARKVHQLPLPQDHHRGTFVAPTIIEIDSLDELTREVFGPVLHVIRFRRDALPHLIKQINATGYGLTLGIHSRIDETIDFIVKHARVGNIYVNRNMVGAVVGVQPFGGEGKSGTGPKAGGPLYLRRLQHDCATDPVDAQAPGITADVFDTALSNLLSWAKSKGDQRLATLCDQYARATLLGKTLPLPGPTGESNTLSFHGRGIALCAASDTSGLLNQLAAALASGNRVAVTPVSAALLPATLPAAIRERILWRERLDDAQQPIDLALVEAPLARSLRPLLAARDGALVPVIETDARTAIPLWRLVVERAISINTAAAGGNASLMTLAA